VFDTSFGQHGRNVFGSGLMRYHATFQTPSGTSSSSGLSGTTALDERYDNPGPNPDRSFLVQSFATVEPVLTVPDNMTVPATSPNGTVVTFALSDITATDDLDPNVTISCDHSSGTFFPVGDTTVTCTAADPAGDMSTASFVVHVSGAAEQAAALANLVLATNAKQGIVNSLDAKVSAVQNALAAANAGNRADARNQLEAFINDVTAQSGKALTPDQVSQLITAARQIRAALGS
jgi:hypothetical protein